MPPLFRAVTFDCWNTLIAEEDWHVAHSLRVSALRMAAREAAIDATEEMARRAFDAAWEHHMALWREGIASGAREVAQWALADLGAAVEGAPLRHLVENFEKASHTSQLVALAGAKSTLQELAEAGVRRALICDTGLTPGRVVRQHLDRLGLLSLLEVQVFSDEVGAPKPDSRIFRAALTAIGERPGEAVHVGDLKRTDVAGARNFGMATVRLRDRNDDSSTLPEADHVADSHAHLREILGVYSETHD